MPRKICVRCSLRKNASSFYANPNTRDRLTAACKKCQKKYNQRPEVLKRRRVNKRKLHLADPRQNMLWCAIRRAKKRGFPCNIGIDDITIPDRCPVFGTVLAINSGHRGAADNSPSLDKIVPERGYVQGNITVISWKANRLKSNATLKELRALVRYLEAPCRAI